MSFFSNNAMQLRISTIKRTLTTCYTFSRENMNLFLCFIITYYMISDITDSNAVKIGLVAFSKGHGMVGCLQTGQASRSKIVQNKLG